MKYFALLFLILIGGIAYFRYSQPKTWNEYVDTVRDTLHVSTQTAPSSGSPSASTPSDDSTDAAPPPKKPAERPAYISPYGTNYINPDHIHQVEQPAPAPASAPDTNAPAATSNGT